MRLPFSLGFVPDEQANIIFEKTGLDVFGFERLLDNFGIRHAFKHHGNDETEEARGQIGIKPIDFERIALILEMPDFIKLDGKNRLGNDVLVFQKNLEARYFFVAEIRTGRRLLALQTFYKQKIRPTLAG